MLMNKTNYYFSYFKSRQKKLKIVFSNSTKSFFVLCFPNISFGD